MVITLIGYRGSGKSTVAKPLAARLGWNWIDADAVIEERAQRTIREIFAAEGEPAFREWERQVLASLLCQKNLVIAAGGGAILNEETRNLMRQSGPVIWLQADIETLYVRIHEDVTTAERRPNLTNLGAKEEIARVLQVREPLYQSSATLVIDTEGLTIESIVNKILEQLPETTRVID
ncbi:MAG: aroK [Planctomycetaceae bacterium]|nr:aroK [Planctomycetaceae bacterium]